MKHYRIVAGVLLLAFVLVLAGCGEPLAAPTPTAEAPAAEDHFELGNQYAQSGQFDQAIAEYEAVLETDPENVSALANLGVVYYHTEQWDLAKAQYERALAVAPDDADLHSNLAAVHVQKNELDAALDEYLKAVELAPDLAPAHFGLGVVYLQLNQADKAIEAFEAFLELDSGQDAMASDQAQQYLDMLKGQ